jgi:hypothetical protein
MVLYWKEAGIQRSQFKYNEDDGPPPMWCDRKGAPWSRLRTAGEPNRPGELA